MRRLALMTAALMLAACGGGGSGTSPATSNTPPTTAPTTATSPVQINLGDDPADRLPLLDAPGGVLARRFKLPPMTSIEMSARKAKAVEKRERCW